MSFGQYVKEQWIFFLFSVGQLGLSILITYLSFLEVGASLNFGNIGYLLLLSSVFMICCLAIDFFRKRPMNKKLKETQKEGALDFYKINALLTDASLTTEGKQWQQVIQKLKDISMAQQRTLEVQNNQYNQMIHQWVHHMKTPVSVISLLVQQEKNKPNSRENVEMLLDVEEENEKIRRGLELILHGARLHTFSTDVKPERVELVQVLREIINEEKRQFIRRKLYPVIMNTEPEVFVSTDQKWLTFVVSQLVLNALKYSNQQQGDEITFTITKEENNNKVTLTITDQGVGIPAHDLPRVFDPFFTGENGRRFRESTGMGLFLVKQFCDQLGHTINIESTVDHGTSITITFHDNSLHQM